MHLPRLRLRRLLHDAQDWWSDLDRNLPFFPRHRRCGFHDHGPGYHHCLLRHCLVRLIRSQACSPPSCRSQIRVSASAYCLHWWPNLCDQSSLAGLDQQGECPLGGSPGGLCAVWVRLPHDFYCHDQRTFPSFPPLGTRCGANRQQQQYVADAYSPLNFAASALAACGTTRSIAGALIPLAIDNMLAALGVAWAITVLAIVSAVLCLVPFAFIIYGEAIRASSPCARLNGLTAEDLGTESDEEEVEQEDNEEDLEKGTGAALKRERTQKSQRTVRSHRSRMSRRSGMSRMSRRSILEMSGANEVGMGELTRSLSAV